MDLPLTTQDRPLSPGEPLSADGSLPSVPTIHSKPPRIEITSQTTAAQLLAAFSPKHNDKKARVSTLQNPPLTGFEIKMKPPRRATRARTSASYTLPKPGDSSPSNESENAFGDSSRVEVSRKRKRESAIDLANSSSEEAQEEIGDVIVVEQPRSMRPRLSPPKPQGRNSLNKTRTAKPPRRSKRDLPVKVRSDLGSRPSLPPRKARIRAEPLKPERSETRTALAATTMRRCNFLATKKDYFLPLLPESNPIEKLITRREEDGDEVKEGNIYKYEELSDPPQGVTATMKPYQMRGLSFLVFLHQNGASGILGDEMGLGKTLQTLALLQYVKETSPPCGNGVNRPSLVICPLSVLSSWMAETKRWTPGLRVLRFHGNVLERERLKGVALGDLHSGHRKSLAASTKVTETDVYGKVDLIVTTYETFSADHQWFKRAFMWKYCILDEGHKIKNDTSLISGNLKGLGAEHRLILTGTPLQNNMSELWALLNWLYPDVFTAQSSDLFKNAFDLSKGKADTNLMGNARRLLELIMLRRTKRSPGVDLNLPPKTEVLLYVPLSPMQKFWYRRLITRQDDGLLEEIFSNAKDKELSVRENEMSTVTWGKEGLDELEKLGEDGGSDWIESKKIMEEAMRQEALEQEANGGNKKSGWLKLMNLLMQLRKCCNHPYIIKNAAPEGYQIGEHVIEASGKFLVLQKIIERLVVRDKKKIIIFSGFTSMLDLCEELLVLRGGDGSLFKFIRFDGSTSRARRNLGIRLFNDKQTDYMVMLISTRAGALGINLATASNVVILDQDWNPQVTLQAEARAHRIGQKEPVTVYKLLSQGTVEEQMMGRIQKKLYLSAKVMEAMRDIHGLSKATSKATRNSTGSYTEDAPQLSANELMSLVRCGAQALSHPEINVAEISGWDWETMLERCRDKTSDIHVSTDAVNAQVNEEDEKKWLSQIEQVESRVFEGKKFQNKKKARTSDPIAELCRDSRRVGKETTVMVDGYAVSKESMNCGEWEAVPTMAGKDPRLAEPVRDHKQKVVQHQDRCGVCWSGSDPLIHCARCPRSFHLDCLNAKYQGKAAGRIQFTCPQHNCADCGLNTTDAGGMIFRCRWCEKGLCEDCLDFEKSDLLGESLKEFELLGFPPVVQAYFIKCSDCKNHHMRNKRDFNICKKIEEKIDRDYEKHIAGLGRKQKEALGGQNDKKGYTKEANGRDELASDGAEQQSNTTPTFAVTRLLANQAPSLSEGTTCGSSGVTTPCTGFDGFSSPSEMQRFSTTKSSTPKYPQAKGPPSALNVIDLTL